MKGNSDGESEHNTILGRKYERNKKNMQELDFILERYDREKEKYPKGYPDNEIPLLHEIYLNIRDNPWMYYKLPYYITCRELFIKGLEKYFHKSSSEIREELENYNPYVGNYKGDYRCPKCYSYNEVWKKRENTRPGDTVYCWHCGYKVILNKV